jgi:hypothetical protein
MRNMDFPVHQALFEEASALYAARYADTSRRIADNDPDEVFTTYMHDEMRDVEVYDRLGESGLTIVTSGAMKMANPHLDKTLDEIIAVAQQVDSNMEMATTKRELKMIDFMSARFDNAHGVEQLQWLGVLTMMAGYNKPSPSIAETVVRQRAPKEPAEYEVFRRAVRRLRSHQLNVGEEESIAAKYDSFVQRVNSGDSSTARAVDALNRYWKGVFVGKMLGRLMDPSLRRAHIIDEVDFLRGNAPEPRHIPPTPGYTTPIIRLPWPMLAKIRGERGSGNGASNGASPQPEATSEKLSETISLPHQTDWVDDLAEMWPYGAQRTRVDDLPTGNRKRPYQGALLNNRHGKPTIHIADTAEPENAMYYAIDGGLRDPDTGEPVPLLEAFKNNKPQARARGAEGIEHLGQDFYRGVMNKIRADMERSESAALPKRRLWW